MIGPYFVETSRVNLGERCSTCLDNLHQLRKILLNSEVKERYWRLAWHVNFVEWNRRMIMVTLSVKFWFVADVKWLSKTNVAEDFLGFVCTTLLRIRSQVVTCVKQSHLWGSDCSFQEPQGPTSCCIQYVVFTGTMLKQAPFASSPTVTRCQLVASWEILPGRDN